MDDDEGARGAPGGLPRARGARGRSVKTAPLPNPSPAAARGAPADAARQPAPPPRDARSPSPSELGEELRVTPNKNRIVQVRRAGRRKLFDAARKETFLEWFAATCNLRLSAGKAGVCEKTVYKHLLKDAGFAEAALRALRVGYFRLEARSMQEAYSVFGQSGALAEGGPSTASGGPPPPGKLGEEYEVRILDDAVAEEHFDPALAMQLLREHRRHLPGSAEKRPAQRTTARAASSEEVAEALAKRLKGFAVRVRGDGASTASGAPPHPAQAAPESPSPRRGEG